MAHSESFGFYQTCRSSSRRGGSGAEVRLLPGGFPRNTLISTPRTRVRGVAGCLRVGETTASVRKGLMVRMANAASGLSFVFVVEASAVTSLECPYHTLN